MLHVRENPQKIKDAHKQFCCYENKDWLEKNQNLKLFGKLYFQYFAGNHIFCEECKKYQDDVYEK